MQRAGRRWILFALLGVCLGCEARKKGDQFAKPIEDSEGLSKAVVSIAGAKPEKSDPASEAIIHELLLKHTQSAPQRLEAIKKHIVRRKGQWNTPMGKLSATMVVHADWPKYRAVYQLEGMQPHTWVFLGGSGWQHAPMLDIHSPQPLAQVDYDRAFPDASAEWFAVLVPLVAGKCIFGPPPEGASTSKKAVRAWVDENPPVVLEVDPSSGLLNRVRFEAREAGRVVARSVQLANHQLIGGVLLPGTVDFFEGPLPLVAWKEVNYELPKQIDPALFEKP